MISNRISNQYDSWSDYFTLLVGDYQSISHGFGTQPEFGLIPEKPEVDDPEIDDPDDIDPDMQVTPLPPKPPVCHPHHPCHLPHIPKPPKPVKPSDTCDHPYLHHPHYPENHSWYCHNQHKPIGHPSCVHGGMFIDDDKPDWHMFKNPNRKPRLYIEVIDKNNPFGPVHIKPLQPVIDPSEEIEDIVDLDSSIVIDDTPVFPDNSDNKEDNEEEDVVTI